MCRGSPLSFARRRRCIARSTAIWATTWDRRCARKESTPFRRVASRMDSARSVVPPGRSATPPICVECWRALGATPVIANFDKLYETLQTHAADAQDNPLNVVELLKLYEVQKYESMTSHMWSGFNLIANLKAWERLPADVQAVIQRNAARFARLQRADNEALNNTLRTRLADRGMIFNTADAASFKAMLGGYYARWKQEIGQKTWTLLERHVGKLG